MVATEGAHGIRESTQTPGENDRFAWFEYPDRDFPFYNGSPVNLSGGQWLLIMLAVVAGFAALLVPVPDSNTIAAQFARAILFSVIPLAMLRALAGSHWKAIFYRIGWRDVGWMVVFWLLNIAATAGVGYIIMHTTVTAPNPAAAGMAERSVGSLAIFFAISGIQLFGEEVFSILPFLAFLWLFHAKLGLRRKPAIICAWIGCAIWFAAAHLPTYGWNFVQCFAVIGLARIMLLLAYLKTKNIFVSFGAHFLNDWAIFGTVAVLGHLSINT